MSVRRVPADLVVERFDGESRCAVGTMMLEISFLPSAMLPVTAVTVTSEVISVPELVMNCLLPLITHSPLSSRAVVRVPPASEPALAR